MNNLILLFSHKLTEDQINDAQNSLNIRNFIYLPEDLQQLWSNVNPQLESLIEYSRPIITWLKKECKGGDYILIQGDFGMVYLFVNIGFELGLIPVYSTTERVFEENKMADGSIEMKKIIKHKRFRKFEREKIIKL